ncbi:murein transglycosylase [Buchnera aphidicola (Hyperomyzus lactucae)]|uniref:peptidoglycan lytic exotransglycosylase n=1 Tax=Buchnera aphidicola (Hyperomyzus lactucae) TaxID=1241860 RepID=A0A4D6XY34_9GAMM|nr:transglycosylase SLT domain-containing protein [Buchnera aphidicola]QCI20987.1 murein transglycosylase [Buchnera aphidicola (Hyperomyzus lactucae)]
MKLGILIISIIFLTGCNKFLNTRPNLKINYFLQKKIIERNLYNWNNLIKEASQKYKVDEKLIKSIIYAESSGNPNAKSSSNAIGLMQIKPSAAGLEVYRLYGKKGQPSIKELYNPKENINIGTAYIHFLEKKFTRIQNKEVMRSAIIVAYVNGMSGLLKIFSKNSKQAITIINTMTMQSFCTYIKKNIQQNKHFLI